MFMFRNKTKKQNGKSSIPRTVAPNVPKKIYSIANLQGVGRRARQEDSFSTANVFDEEKMAQNGMLFVVCDGMGGMRDGKLASETAISSIRASFMDMDRNGDIAHQLKESIYIASERVEELLEGEGGSTVVAGIIYKDELYYASVGDSYFYLKRGDNVYRLNKEHNMCNQVYLSCIREGELDPSIGRTHEEAVALTQFLGMYGFEDVDCFIKPMPIREGDVLLACSDGVGGVLNEREIYEALSLSEPQEMCTYIEERIKVYNKSNQDNYTAIVVQCK